MDIAILLIGIVAIAYFLAQSGFVNYISGGSTISYALGWDKISSSTDPAVNTNFYIYFTPEQDVASATWLSMFMEDNSLIYSDWVSIAHPLRIYGMISDESLSTLTIGTQMGTNSYVYLRYFNIADRVITPTVDSVFNITDISSALSESNLEYSNGKSNVYASQLP